MKMNTRQPTHDCRSGEGWNPYPARSGIGAIHMAHGFQPALERHSFQGRRHSHSLLYEDGPQSVARPPTFRSADPKKQSDYWVFTTFSIAALMRGIMTFWLTAIDSFISCGMVAIILTPTGER